MNPVNQLSGQDREHDPGYRGLFSLDQRVTRHAAGVCGRCAARVIAMTP
jgi:hypothetical protein